MKIFIVIAVLLLSCQQATADVYQQILPMKQRAEIIDKQLQIRFKTLVPELMQRENIDMWVLIAREYNEDPVLMTMLPGTSHAARRRTVLIFVDEDDKGVNGYAVSKYGVGDYFQAIWDPEQEPDQWRALSEFIKEKNPRTIGLNISETFALADGLTHGEYKALMAALSDSQKNKIVPAESLAVSWLETRTAEEMQIYPAIVSIAHQIIREGFSSQVITPGKTTTEDVIWWFRDRIKELRLDTWFHPSVSIQRSEGAQKQFTELFQNTEKDGVIMHGDLLHVDFGITYLRLNTDTQQHAYVLTPGETDAPQGLKDALKKGNQLQDILMSHFKTNRTGNEILKMSRSKAIQAGLDPSIYSHPIGYQGHGAGPTIGMWDNQDDTLGKGDFPLHANTAYSIELSVMVNIPEWEDKIIRIMLEEDAFFDGEQVTFLVPRQTELILIDSVNKR